MAISAQPGSNTITPDSRTAWLVYSTLLFSTFATIEAAGFQSAALPAVSHFFGIPVAQAALITLFYFVGSIAFAPVMGRLADRIGYKRVIIGGLVIFSLSEVLAFSSRNFPTFLASHLLQGISLACIAPVILAYAGSLFTKQRRGTALGAYVFAASVGATSGGLLGGVLVDHFGWPAIYWVGCALGLVGLVVITLLVPAQRGSETARRGFDPAGVALLFVGVASLLSSPAWANRFGVTSVEAIGALTTGIACLVALWFVERRASDPVVDIALLRNRAFALPAVIYLLYYLFYIGILNTLTFFIADRPGGSASQIGVVMLFLYGSNTLTAPLAGRLIDKVDPRKLLIASLLVAFGGLFLISTIRNATPLAEIIVAVVLLGVANGAKTPAVMKIALAQVQPEKLGAGSGLLSMLRDIGAPAGSAFGLAMFGATIGARTRGAALHHAREIGLNPAALEAAVQAAASHSKNVPPILGTELARLGLSIQDFLLPVKAAALDTAMAEVAYMLMAVLAACLLLALLLRRNQGATPAVIAADPKDA